MAEQAVIRSRRPDTQHPDVAPEPEPEAARSRSRASTWSTADVRLCFHIIVHCLYSRVKRFLLCLEWDCCQQAGPPEFLLSQQLGRASCRERGCQYGKIP